MLRRVGFVALSVLLVAAVVVVASGAAPEGPRNIYKLMGILGQTVALVRSSYVDEVPVERLELGATTGLVEAADPGGAWVPEEQAAAFEAVRLRTTPPFGVVLGKRASYPFLLQVVENSPAAAAGLEAGQLVERIGGEPVRARPLWRAQVYLDRGERDGQVELQVVDTRRGRQFKVALRRAPVVLPPPRAAAAGEVPVIRLGAVTAAAAQALEGALAPHAGAAALVLDLRGTALGTAAEAVQVAAVLGGGRVELQAQGREGPAGVLRARGPERTWRVVVCVDGTTAHAAEVLALALRSRGAVLVGGETYGDAATRRPFASPGGKVWLATEWFLAAEGTPLLGQGLRPDEVVRPRAGEDAILQRALEIAREARSAKAA